MPGQSNTLYRFACTLLLLSTSFASALTRGTANSPNVAEQLLLSEANQDRVVHSLSPLKRDPLLAEAALFHAFQMADHADISHGFPGEPDLSSRGAKAGVHFSLITENVAEAQDPKVIHTLWMNSPGHRANLLDPEVNVVGIAVVTKNDEVFAVEDFATTVDTLSLDEQESSISRLLSSSGLQVVSSDPQLRDSARHTCGMQTGYVGQRQPWYIMRYTASRLDQLPAQIQSKLTSGKYHQVAVGACLSSESTAFTSYNITILLYP